MSREKYELAVQASFYEALERVHLEVFGDELARRNKYRAHAGLDALHFYLVSKFGFTPAQVRALPLEDLRFLLAEELTGWTLPKALRDAVQSPRPHPSEVAQVSSAADSPVPKAARGKRRRPKKAKVIFR